MLAQPVRYDVRTSVGLTTFWVGALAFCLRTMALLDDQFGRISPGRQIIVSGELPFRDFLDPGYFFAEFSSASVQWLFGENLLGELLLNAAFIATGCLLVCVVVRRLSGRMDLALATGTVALLTLPRAYDYDKVLSYPLGILMVLRWLELPRPGRLFGVSLTVVMASLYRYDNGVWLGIAAVAGATSMAWRQPRMMLGLAASLVLTSLVLSVPALLFVETHGGVRNAVDQALTYATREADRTRITALPRVHPGTRFFAVNPSPPSGNVVLVRWAAGAVADNVRSANARRLGLQELDPVGPPERRTWRYTLADASAERIRNLVNDPTVEDTDGINRATLELLQPESRWLRLQRVSPLLRFRLMPEAWTFDNAEAVVFYALLLIPILSAVALGRHRTTIARLDRAVIVAVIVLCVLLDLFILRDPINARVGGIAGPFALLTAWLVHRWLAATAGLDTTRFAHVGTRLSLTCIGALVLWSLASTAEWSRQLAEPLSDPLAFSARLAAFARTPPDIDLLPSGRLAGMVRYLRRCTNPPDHVFASWFTPQLFYFAQRGFGGGMSATFGSHWSEPRFQQRSIAAFESQPTPLVLVRAGGYQQFSGDYPLLMTYVEQHYRPAGESSFGDADAGPGGYRVLIRLDRAASSLDQETGLPCLR